MQLSFQNKFLLLVAGTCVASIIFLLQFQPLYLHDYYNYLIDFRLTLAGYKDIWGRGYPLFYNLLAGFLVLGPYGPKIALSVFYHLWIVIFARDLAEMRSKKNIDENGKDSGIGDKMQFLGIEISPRTKRDLLPYLLFALFNPLVWSLVYYFGEYDILVGIFIYMGVVAAKRDHSFQAGIFIGCAAMFKFGGVLVILPILFLRKLNIKFIMGLAAFFGVVLGVGYIYFGTDVIWKLVNPFLRQGLQSRVDNFSVVQEFSSFGAFLKFIETIDIYAVGLLMVIGFYFSRRRENGDLQAAVIQLLIFLAFFKVKNFQYFLWLVPLYMLWRASEENAIPPKEQRMWDFLFFGLSVWITIGLVFFAIEWVPHQLFEPVQGYFFGPVPLMAIFLYVPTYLIAGFHILRVYKRTPEQKERAHQHRAARADGK